MAKVPKELKGGRLWLELPELNKGTAFTRKERIEGGLLGMVPYSQEELSAQVSRAYKAYAAKDSDLEKHIFLRQLQTINETLFYELIIQQAASMLPVIYTPTVGNACELFSEIYRKPFGLFLNYPEREFMDEILENVANDDVEVIVMTDGEAILGIGDQGVGGMGIPIGKLSLYSALGGIDPKVTLPVVLDVGTNNNKLLESNFYVGWKHARIRGQEYDEFIELVLSSIHKKWPHAVVQFEDFGVSNSLRLLDKYVDRLCCFNDDIQGTAAITVGSLIAASRVTGQPLTDSKIVIVGAGAAGTGIAHGIVLDMMRAGMEEESARRRIYMLNSKGLIRSDSPNLLPQQIPFAQPRDRLVDWKGDFQLLDVVRNVNPDVLIGVSGQSGYFSEEIVREMTKVCHRPCIFPLSNPTSKAEAFPGDILRWTGGRAIVATGSPFDQVALNGINYEIAQCNNAYAFPGIGLGLSAIKAKKVTDEMLNVVANVIGNAKEGVKEPGTSILPPLDSIRELSREVAIAVANVAVEQDLTGCDFDCSIEDLVDSKMWCPGYEG